MKKSWILFLVLFLILFVYLFLSGYMTGLFVGKLGVVVDEGIIVNYSNFGGSTTNLLEMNDSRLQNITNLVLEKESTGKIVFTQKVNLTKNVHNNFVDLNSYINISKGYAFINTSILDSLDKSAIIYFYGLSFSEPIILKNGEVCPDSECHIISYSGGTLTFSVEGFSSYEAIENPSLQTSQNSGGGSSTTKTVPDFRVGTNLIKVSSFQGESTTKDFELTNNGTQDLVIELSTSDTLNNHILFEENYFILKSGESRNVSVTFYSKEKEIPDIYAGKIYVKSSGIKKSLNVLFEVKERSPLFDVLVNSSKSVSRGGTVNSNIKILNMGNLKGVDLLLYYSLRNFEGENFVYREESLFINDSLNLHKSLDVPDNFKDDSGIFYVKVSYKNITATASDTFRISGSKTQDNLYYIIGGIFLFVLLVIIVRFFIENENKSQSSS